MTGLGEDEGIPIKVLLEKFPMGKARLRTMIHEFGADLRVRSPQSGKVQILVVNPETKAKIENQWETLTDELRNYREDAT